MTEGCVSLSKKTGGMRQLEQKKTGGMRQLLYTANLHAMHLAPTTMNKSHELSR